MARNRGPKPLEENINNTNETEEPVVSATTEAPEVEVAAEAPAEVASAEETPTVEAKVEKKAPVEFDLSAFQTAVIEAVAAKDDVTGDVLPAHTESVGKAYREVEGIKGKNAAKKLVADGMRDAMNKGDINEARAYMNLSDHLSATVAHSGTPRTPTDPTEAFVHLVVGLRLAEELALGNVPDGVNDGWEENAKATVEKSREEAATYLAWVKSTEEDKGDEPETSVIVKSAVKLSVGKSAKVGGAARGTGGGGSLFTGERRNIGNHILEAFADVPSGTFLSISEIRKHQSTEYGTNPPSAGAISARLFPKSGKCTLEGIKPGMADGDTGHKGATKV